jgi:signal transduction histidine kinase
MVFNQDRDLRYTWVHNQALLQPAREMTGKTDAEVFPAEEADWMTQIKARVLLTGAGSRQEISHTINGQKHYYDLTVESVKGPSGAVTGITGAAMDVTERKRLEEQILHISELEQRRLGQDLHDGICQRLTAIELKTQTLVQMLDKRGRDAVAQAEEIAAHMREVIAQTRSLARGLSPFILESEGLTSALRELAANSARLFNVNCLFHCDSPAVGIDQGTATHLYRIAQEAVTNAVKHGKAASIEIHLSFKDDRLVLTVSDNGVGLTKAPGAGPGMGLRTMQYRAGMIGAALLVQSQAKGGTRIVCFLQRKGNPKTQ